MPIYKDIIQYVTDRINDGVFPRGSLLPTEQELCDMFNTSRMTVRKALDELENKNVIYRIQGKGSFVPAFEINNYSLSGFTKTMENKGLRHSTQVLCFEERAASKSIAEALRVRPDARVWYLKRLRCVEGEPVSIEKLYYNAALFPNFLSHDFSKESVFAVLRQEYNYTPHIINMQISTRDIDGLDAEMLFGKPFATALLAVNVGFDQSGVPLEYCHAYCNGNRYSIDVLIR
jgi:GntR family transcriptional regulator